MEYLLALIAVAPSLATLIYTVIKDKKQNKTALNRAVGFLLLKSLKEDAGESIRNGEITPTELEILEESYALYHELGGNGFADAVMAQTRKLPIRGVHNEK